MKIPLFEIEWKQEDIDAISKVIKRGGYWTQGPEVEEFEDRIAYRVGTKYAVACNSGTSALHLALVCAGIKEGDEVIVPSFTFISTVNSIKFVGAKPVFADIENRTCGLNIGDVKKKITKKTKAIIVVHYGGCPAFYTEELKEFAKKHDIFLIEDSAASLGAHISGNKTGTFGDFGILSFCQNKIITTGEGGMVVTNSEENYEKLKLICSHGQKGSNYTTLGYNFRMSSINASLGLSQLNRLDDIIYKRREIAKRYLYDLKNVKKLVCPPWFYNVYWVFQVRTDKETKKPMMEYLAKNKIATKSYYIPVHLTDYYLNGNRLPVTEEIYNTSFCLPIYPTLTYEQVSYIIDTVNNYR